jgi:adenylate kinase
MRISFLSFMFFCMSTLYGANNFVLIGPPGSGKGTFSSYMVQKFGYSQICPGDLVREQVKKQTKLGKEMEPIVKRGDYISDSIIFKMIKDCILEAIKKKQPFIIDGFPRSVEALNFLNSVFTEQKIESEVAYIHFKIEDEICVDRITNRLVCFNCKSIFNKTTQKPKVNMVCDSCKGKLETRIGDSEENAKKRLLYYRENIEPLVKKARLQFDVIELAANSSSDTLYKKFDELFLFDKATGGNHENNS